jgi:hypothetical protein
MTARGEFTKSADRGHSIVFRYCGEPFASPL